MKLHFVQFTHRFLLSHKLVSAFICSLLALLFVVQIFVYSCVKAYIQDENPFSDETKLLYTCTLPNAGEAEVYTFISQIASYKNQIAILSLNGETTACDANGSAYSFAVSAYYPDMAYLDIYSLVGNMDFQENQKQVYITTMAEWSAAGNNLILSDDKGKYMILGNNQTMYRVIGDGAVRNAVGTQGLIVSYLSFFAVSDSCTSLLIQCKEPLSDRDEAKLLQIIKIQFPGAQIELPYEYSEQTSKEFYRQLAFCAGLLLIASMNAMALFSYLISLRMQEFRILRILGASKMSVTASILYEAIVLFAMSVLGQLVITVILKRIFSYYALLSNLTLYDGLYNLAGFAVIFCLSVLIQTCRFFYQNGISMTEEENI